MKNISSVTAALGNGLGYDFVVENVGRLFRLWNHAGIKVQSLKFRTKPTMNYSHCCALVF